MARLVEFFGTIPAIKRKRLSLIRSLAHILLF